MDYKAKLKEKEVVLKELHNQISLTKQNLVNLENNFNQVIGQIQMLNDLIKEADNKEEK